ncbi:hypothetical protein DBV15_09184 [Temnothorax longispinosus]|uniref:Uncharacterized protein n=1 Tax=Temnothorax longispinosus TaxID=300112 RepID=A0A4V6RGK3_9HYME|nr:hypothetical protein DBV15_09184 [Temnothorax longispinosus]
MVTRSVTIPLECARALARTSLGPLSLAGVPHETARYTIGVNSSTNYGHDDDGMGNTWRPITVFAGVPGIRLVRPIRILSRFATHVILKNGDVITSHEPAYKFIDTLPLPICNTMRLTEAPRKRQRTEETTDEKNPGSRRRRRCTLYRAPAAACCSGTKMAMRKRRESKENGPRNLRFHLVARACPSRLSSWLDRGRGPRETRPPASRVKPPSSLSVPLSCTDIAHGVGPQKMHPETQPLSRRAHSYSILALCFSTPVIFADDYIVGMLARPQPRTESRRDSQDISEENSGSDFFQGSRDVQRSTQQSTFPGQRRDTTAATWTTKCRGKKGSARIVNAPEP